MATDKEQVYGYVSPDVKARLKRIREKDSRCSESWVIGKCLEATLASVEREVGIVEPVQRPRSRKAD